MSKTTQFPCPSCGYAYTEAKNTNRARSGTETRRQRTCLHCKTGFVTYEIRASDYDFLQAARRFIANQSGSQPEAKETRREETEASLHLGVRRQ